MPATPTQKKNIRDSIAAYCRGAVANEPRIHYSQARPFPFVDRIDVGWHTLDCSGFVGNCFWNAMHDTKIYLHDPLDQKYSGYGNTWTEEAWLRAAGKRVVEANGYLIGDIARWGTGSHSHTGICSKAGSATSSVWTSHGSEGGPHLVGLGYRSDLVGVWRHPALT